MLECEIIVSTETGASTFVYKLYPTFTAYKLVSAFLVREHTTMYFSDPCSEGFTFIHATQQCYAYFAKEYKNWQDAKTKCEQEGNSLVVLETSQVMTVVKEWLAKGD